MRDIPCQALQVARPHDIAGGLVGKFDAAFQALHGQLTYDLMFWHLLAGEKNHAKHFEMFRLV